MGLLSTRGSSTPCLSAAPATITPEAANPLLVSTWEREGATESITLHTVPANNHTYKPLIFNSTSGRKKAPTTAAHHEVALDSLSFMRQRTATVVATPARKVPIASSGWRVLANINGNIEINDKE